METNNPFSIYWEKNKAVLSSLGVSEKVASVIFYNGMSAGADQILANVEAGMQNLKIENNGGYQKNSGR